LAENEWPTMAENRWPSLGENAWPSLGENLWPIIARKMTQPARSQSAGLYDCPLGAHGARPNPTPLDNGGERT
jgi:hypothetical protein